MSWSGKSECMVKPYNEHESKKEQVARMFDNIAGRYDFLNHFFSLRIDFLWRKKAIRLLRPYKPKRMLDVATGTADFAVAALKLDPEQVIGTDISRGMLAEGEKKIVRKGLDQKIHLEWADAENLPYEDNSFDAIVVGFGVRNFENLEKGLSDMARVLKPGKAAAILELSSPHIFPVKQLYWFYFQVIMPVIGRLVSSDNNAYSYLPESVRSFPSGQRMADILKKCGYTSVRVYPVTGGIASIYLAEK